MVAVPPKRYRIGEVMSATGLSRQVVHQYTTLGLISEVDRTGGNQRLYGPEVFARLERIAGLRRQGMTLAAIRRALDEEAAAAAGAAERESAREPAGESEKEPERESEERGAGRAAGGGARGGRGEGGPGGAGRRGQ